MEAVKVDDIVVLRDENLPPIKRSLGKVTAVYRGQYELVWVVPIKTATTELKRSIVKICVLPCNYHFEICYSFEYEVIGRNVKAA